MQAVEDEQHFLFDCAFYSIIRGQHFSLFGPNYQRYIRLFFEQNSHQLGFVAHHLQGVQLNSCSICSGSEEHPQQNKGSDLPTGSEQWEGQARAS